MSSDARTSVVRLTPTSHEQMERFRTEHETHVLTLLLSDLVGSTAQQSRLGNVRAARLVQAHRAIFRDTMGAFDGTEVETAGDSFLAVFAAPSEGVRFALRLQAAMRAARRDTPELPSVRVGVHQGQVVVERHAGGPKAMDIYGLQVSTAARIMALGVGGQVLCSRAVFDDARAILRGEDFAGLSPVGWCNHGPYRFKGVEDAHEVCEVGEEALAPFRRPGPSATGWPADQLPEELGWRPAVGVTVPETNWVLEERLGREEGDDGGGFRGEFGEVWKAWNPGDKSRQAFKFCFRRDRVPALKREARLLKRLRRYRHPNLVEVYDVTEGERPPYYLEMEYVPGPSLAEWLAGGPPLAERLEVIAQVADALGTVHAAGIFHRDIKPGNVLLTHREDGSLQAKLSDFGLGSAEDEQLLKSIASSRISGVAGTWDYLAPEIREGHPATAQSDLFSLGITLYQLVAGDLRRPLTGDWANRMPSEVLREDVRRCVAADPAERWSRADELATALRSHGQRVRQRELERERARQQRRARRLRAILGLVGLVTLVTLVFGGFATLQWREARKQRREAERQRNIAQGARDRADQQKRIAQRERDHALDAANAIIRELTAGIHKPIPGYIDDQVRLIQRAQAVYDRLMKQMPEREDILESKARALQSLAEAYGLLGDMTKARQALEQRLPIVRKLAGAHPDDPDRLIALLQALTAVIRSRIGALDLEGARRATGDAVAALDRLRALAPPNSQWAWAVPVFQWMYQQNLRNATGAPMNLHEAAQKFQSLADATPGGQKQLIAALFALMNKLQGRSLKDSAGFASVRDLMQWLEEGMPPRGPRSDSAEAQQRHANRLAMQAEVLLNQGDLAGAARCYEQAEQVLRTLHQADPRNANWSLSLADVTSRFAAFKQTHRGDPDGAITLYREVARIYQGHFDAGFTDVAYRISHIKVLQQLVTLHGHVKGDTQAALAASETLQAILKRLLDDGIQGDALHATVARWYADGLRARHLLAGTPPDAQALLTWFNKSLELRRRVLRERPEDPSTREEIAAVLLDVARTHAGAGESAAALEAFDEAVAIRRQLAKDGPDSATRVDALADALDERATRRHAAGDQAGCLEDRRELVALAARLAADYPAHPRAQHRLARARHFLAELRPPREAVPALEANVALCRRWHQAHPRDPQWQEALARALQALGIHFHRQQRLDDALPLLRHSVRLYDRLSAAEPKDAAFLLTRAYLHWLVGSCQQQLGFSHTALDSHRKAQAAAQAALPLTPGDPSAVAWIATATRSIALLRIERGDDPAQAAQGVEGAIQAVRAFAARQPHALQCKHSLAALHGALAATRRARRDPKTAQADNQARLRLLDEVLDAQPQHPYAPADRIHCLLDLAADQASLRDVAAATSTLERAAQLLDQLQAPPARKLGLVDQVSRRRQRLPTLVATLDDVDQQRAAAPDTFDGRRRFLATLVAAEALLTELLEYRARPVLQAEIRRLAPRLAAEKPADRDLLLEASRALAQVAGHQRAEADLRAALGTMRALVGLFKNAAPADPPDYGTDAALVYWLGYVANIHEHQLGEPAAARAALAELVQLASRLLRAPSPALPRARSALGRALAAAAGALVHSTLPDVPGAGQALRPAAERACALFEWKDPAAVHALARVCFSLNDLEGAIDAQQKAVALKPGDPRLQAYLRMLRAARPAPDAERLLLTGHEAAVDAVAFVHGQPRLLSFSRGRVLRRDAYTPAYSLARPAAARLWDAADRREVLRFQTLPKAVACFAASPDGARAVTVDPGGKLQLWNVATGEPTRSFDGAFGEARAVVFLPDGRRCAVACGRIRATKDGKEVWQENSVVRLWDLEAGRQTCCYEGHDEPLRALAVSRDGQRILSAAKGRFTAAAAAAAEVRDTLCLWSAADGAELWRHRVTPADARTVALAPDAQHVLTGALDGTIRLRHGETGNVVREFRNEGKSTAVVCLRVSPDGRRVLAGYNDCSLRLWDLQTGEQLARYVQHVGPVTAVAFSADATQALSGSADHTIRLWKLPD